MTAPLHETPLAPGLYIVATPIGNLADMTFRAVDILKRADIVLCEDTRVAGKLFSAHGISTPLRRYDDHTGARARPEIIERLKDRAAIALISDAGTPLVSDPGYKLVRECRDAGLPVHAAPGPSALLAALAVAGAPTDRFLFAGFLPPKSGPRRSALEPLVAIDATLVFYETGPRLAGALAAMAEGLGDRRASVARELTKLHEDVREGRLADLAAHYADAGPPKGEIVIVVHPPEAPEAASNAAIDAALREALKTMSVRDAADAVAADLDAKRRAVYARALALQGVDDAE